jgi:hypothetical protein
MIGPRGLALGPQKAEMRPSGPEAVPIERRNWDQVVSFCSHKLRSRRRDRSRGTTMRAQRVWKPFKHDAEIERLHLELASFNNRIVELEKLHPESSKIETLKARALVLSRQIDELRCSSATDDLTGLLAK